MKLRTITRFDQVNWTSAGIGFLFVLLCIFGVGKTLTSLGTIMAKTPIVSEKSQSTEQTVLDETVLATPSATPELLPTESPTPTETITPTQTPPPTVTPMSTIMETPTPTIEINENTRKDKKFRTLPFWKLPFDR